ncbi:bifunctional transcriptional activator/DNA repair enzyme AdaA [Oceanobacillus picturae]|uniref:bifunctional transcriptional activator/DNA repair enzyme AdaA n=1 Tax=Oceanobacillus picturae TaxID=171693 RepID=UPI003627DB77
MENLQWKAIKFNDSSYDGQFFYALKSTGTFCRPSCPSRLPNKNNVQIFYNEKDAIQHGYRACKRCRPDFMEWEGPKKEMVLQVKNYILEHYDEKITLNRISTSLSFDPSYIHRTFKQITGVSPLQFLHQVRIEKAKELLLGSKLTATQIGITIGYASLSHFSIVFKERIHMSPSSFRNDFK